ncbi:outer membrane beta-barrel protein [candidate division WOR-3 bacterium]|nr:outer membrane beta-barrel protein [candidate division WOR-3 bacterium]
MKKLIAILAIVVIATSPTFAGMGIGGFGNFSMPFGDFKEASDMGLGGGAKFCYGVMPGMDVEVAAGYLMFSGKTIDMGILGKWTTDYSFIPITAGINYCFLTEPVKVYVAAGGGFYMCSFKGTVKVGGSSSSTTTSESKLGFATGLGMEYPISETMSFDLNAKYNHILTTDALQFFGINAGIIYYFGVQNR